MRYPKKLISRMTPAEINRWLDYCQETETPILDALIADGRGHETLDDMRDKTDSLSVAQKEVNELEHQLRFEIKRRSHWDPSLSSYRCPAGLMPIKEVA